METVVDTDGDTIADPYDKRQRQHRSRQRLAACASSGLKSQESRKEGIFAEKDEDSADTQTLHWDAVKMHLSTLKENEEQYQHGKYDRVEGREP